MSYSTFWISKNLDIKVDRLKDWMSRGYLAPSIQRAQGQGTKNLFSRQDLYLISLFKYLLERGISRKEAAKVVETFQQSQRTKDVYNEFFGRIQNALPKKKWSRVMEDYKEDYEKMQKDIEDRMHRFRSATWVAIFRDTSKERVEVGFIDPDEKGVLLIPSRKFDAGTLLTPRPLSIYVWDDIVLVNFAEIRKSVDVLISSDN